MKEAEAETEACKYPIEILIHLSINFGVFIIFPTAIVGVYIMSSFPQQKVSFEDLPL